MSVWDPPLTSVVPLESALLALFAFKVLSDLENSESVCREGCTESTRSLARYAILATAERRGLAIGPQSTNGVKSTCITSSLDGSHGGQMLGRTARWDGKIACDMGLSVHAAISHFDRRSPKAKEKMR